MAIGSKVDIRCLFINIKNFHSIMRIGILITYQKHHCISKELRQLAVTTQKADLFRTIVTTSSFSSPTNRNRMPWWKAQFDSGYPAGRAFYHYVHEDKRNCNNGNEVVQQSNYRSRRRYQHELVYILICWNNHSQNHVTIPSSLIVKKI